MTKTTMSLADLVAKHDDGDFLRAVAESVLQLIMKADVDGVIGAGCNECQSAWNIDPQLVCKNDPPAARFSSLLLGALSRSRRRSGEVPKSKVAFFLRGGQARVLKRQLSLPVSRISQ